MNSEEVSKVFQRGRFNGVLSGFQGSLVQWVFEGSVKGVSWKFLRKIEGCTE